MFSTVTNFLAANYGNIAAALVAAATLGAVVARMTPNKKDDALFAKALAFLQKLPTLGLAPKAKPGA